MTSFMLKIGALDTAVLTTAYADGAAWTNANTYSGIVEQLGDPTSEAVLSASNPASTVETTITVGTVDLGAAQSPIWHHPHIAPPSHRT
eukprot:1553551-Prymnesium_polylepis.1